MPYDLYDRVEILYKGEWYRGIVVGEDVLSRDGVLCMKVLFNPNDPTGLTVEGRGIYWLPNDQIDTHIRHYLLHSMHASLRVNKSSAFKNSVDIRF